MAFKDYIPFIGLEKNSSKSLQPILGADDLKVLPKLFKSIGLAVGYTGGTYSIGFNRVNFEPAPYDFDKFIQAIDTDSYVKQGFNQYKELFWKEGYSIISQNPEAVEYIKLRISFMELSMQRSFQSFLVDVADQLVKFGNAFIVKVRGDIEGFLPVPVHPIYGAKPVIGYQLLPAETVEIMRDYHNKPIKYRQNIWGAHGYNAPSGFGRGEKGYANLLPTWRPHEVIHFSIDVKPGRLFGTPFFVSVIQDVQGLRQIEEDVQNLVHRELFPIYKYVVGTEDHPAEPDEISAAARTVEGLGSGGGVVLPERHDITVVGSEGKALDIQPYLDHFKERVAVGMGLSKRRLGMSNADDDKEEDDTKIYDKIKLYQKTFGDMVRLFMFNELLLEGDFDPFVEHKDKLDTCHFVFNEIDVDTQVKKENHIVQKWISDMMTWEETRIELKEPLDADRQELYTAITNRELAPPEAPGKPIKPGAGTPSWTANKKTGVKKPATGGAPPTSAGGVSVNKPAVASRGGSNNTPKLTGPPGLSKTNPRQKAVANRSMPTNQYGSRTSNISAKTQKLKASEESDIMWLEEIADLFGEDE